jgi:hypothetical protein
MLESRSTFMRIFIALLLALLPVHALAECANREELLRQAYPEAMQISDGYFLAGDYAQHINPEDVACKVWPYRPDLTLLAVPLLEAEPRSEGEVRGDVEVIVADSRTGEPLARLRERGMAYGDAIQFAGVELDTARYDLRPGVRAFGLVTWQYGSSKPNPYSERSLWLYAYSAGRIDRVLDGLVIGQLNGENDGNCTGETTEIARTVGIASTEHEGHRDLTVDEMQIYSLSKPTSDDCPSIEFSRKTRQLMLRFEAGRYRSSVDPEADRLFSYIEIAQ